MLLALNNFKLENPAITISLFALLFSSLSLYFAAKTYYVYAKRQTLNKQIELVFELIEEIQKDAMNIDFYTSHSNGSSSSGMIGPSTIFGLTIGFLERWCYTQSLKKNHYHDKPVFFDSTRLSDILSNYVYNPLTPVSIANEIEILMNKNTGSANQYQYIKDKKNCVVVIHNKKYTESDLENLQKNSYLHFTPAYETPGYDSYKDFLICNTNLKKSILAWLKLNNIDDINIRYR